MFLISIILLFVTSPIIIALHNHNYMRFKKRKKEIDNIIPSNDVNLPVSLKYHKYLDKSFTNEKRCAKPKYIGYFPFALDVTFIQPSSTVFPTHDLKSILHFEFAAHNFWILEYLPNLCDDLMFVFRLDEDIVSQSKICEMYPSSSKPPLKDGQFLAYKHRSLELSIGYHILRMAPIYIPPSSSAVNDGGKTPHKYFPIETWFGRQSVTSVWFAWDHFSHRKKAIENYFNLNPSDLYDYSQIKQKHGWNGLASYATKSANEMFKNYEYLSKDSSKFPLKEQNWTYANERNKDPNYYIEYPTQIMDQQQILEIEETRYIIFRPPSGGLNNQIKEIIQFIAISHVLNRTLILPRLSIEKPRLMHWGVNKTIEFKRLFNVDQMRFNLMGIIRFIDEDDFNKINIKPNALKKTIYTAPHSREAPLDWYRREYGYLRKHWPILKMQSPDGLSHYLVKFVGPHALNLENRIQNALVFEDTLVKAGRFVRNNLLKVANENGQNNYVALHARVENDWREHCIHMERLWGFEIEMWTPPSLILKRMNKVKLFQDIKVLYISVNIQTYDEHENGNIFEIFSKHTSQKEQHYLPYKLSNFTDKYNIGEMPYLLRSAVDFIICTESSVFVGNGFSTFSQYVSKHHSKFHKPSFVYNIRNSDRVHLRTDNGLLLEPLSAVELRKKDMELFLLSSANVTMDSKNVQKHIKSLSSRLLSTSNNGPISDEEIHYYKPLFQTKQYDAWPFYIEQIYVLFNGKKTFYLFEKTETVKEITAFCVKYLPQENNLVNSCKMHFFKTANEQMSIFHLLENRKLRYTLRSGPLKDGDMLRSLKEIGIEENNDKITFHHYDDVYSFLFKNLRERKLKILEIGISQSSMSLWQRYFPYAKIYGVDLGIWDGCGLYNNRFNTKFGCKYSDRVQLFQGDILDQKFLTRLVEVVGEVDIIIDDGAHTPEHSIVPFFKFFSKLLKPGGIYSIEDIETNYWNADIAELYGNKINAGKGTPSSMVEWFKDMIDTVNRHFFNPEYYTLNKIEHMIESLHFSHNVLIAKKRKIMEVPFENSQYRFSTYVDGYGYDDTNAINNRVARYRNNQHIIEMLNKYI